MWLVEVKHTQEAWMIFQLVIKHLIDIMNPIRQIQGSENTRGYQSVQFLCLHSQKTVGMMGSILGKCLEELIQVYNCWVRLWTERSFIFRFWASQLSWSLSKKRLDSCCPHLLVVSLLLLEPRKAMAWQSRGSTFCFAEESTGITLGPSNPVIDSKSSD